MAMTVSRFFTVSAFVHGERRRRKVKFLNHLLTIDGLLSLTGDRSASAIPARERSADRLDAAPVPAIAGASAHDVEQCPGGHVAELGIASAGGRNGTGELA